MSERDRPQSDPDAGERDGRLEDEPTSFSIERAKAGPCGHHPYCCDKSATNRSVSSGRENREPNLEETRSAISES